MPSNAATATGLENHVEKRFLHLQEREPGCTRAIPSRWEDSTMHIRPTRGG